MKNVVSIVGLLLIGAAVGMLLKDIVFPPAEVAVVEDDTEDIVHLFLMKKVGQQQAIRMEQQASTEMLLKNLLVAESNSELRKLVEQAQQTNANLNKRAREIDQDTKIFLDFSWLSKRPKKPPRRPIPPSPCPIEDPGAACYPIRDWKTLLMPDTRPPFAFEIRAKSGEGPVIAQSGLVEIREDGSSISELKVSESDYTGPAYMTLSNGEQRFEAPLVIGN